MGTMFITGVLSAVLCALGGQPTCFPARIQGKSLVYLHLDSRRADRLQRTLRVGMQHSIGGSDVTDLAWAS